MFELVYNTARSYRCWQGQEKTMLYVRTIDGEAACSIVAAFREALRLWIEASTRMRELEQSLDLVILASNPEPFSVTAGRFQRLATGDGPYALRGFDPRGVPYGILLNAESLAWAGPTLGFSFYYDPQMERAIINIEYRDDGDPIDWKPTSGGWELVPYDEDDDFPDVPELGTPIGGQPTRPFAELLKACEVAGVTVQFLHEMLEDVRRVRISFEESDTEGRSPLELTIMQMAHRRSHEHEGLLEETMLALLWETTTAIVPLPVATSHAMQYREIDKLPYEQVFWRANRHLLDLMGVGHLGI